MKLVKSVQAKFIQPKIFTPPPLIESKPTVAQILKGTKNDSATNKAAQEKRAQNGLKSGNGSRKMGPSDSSNRV
jgi:hypothetical protein